MGTISFQVTETGQTPLARTFTLPDAHIDRMVAAYQSVGNQSIGGTATRAQVLNAWCAGLMQETVAYVVNAEQQVAVSAVVIPAPITPV